MVDFQIKVNDDEYHIINEGDCPFRTWTYNWGGADYIECRYSVLSDTAEAHIDSCGKCPLSGIKYHDVRVCRIADLYDYGHSIITKDDVAEIGTYKEGQTIYIQGYKSWGSCVRMKCKVTSIISDEIVIVKRIKWLGWNEHAHALWTDRIYPITDKQQKICRFQIRYDYLVADYTDRDTMTEYNDEWLQRIVNELK